MTSSVTHALSRVGDTLVGQVRAAMDSSSARSARGGRSASGWLVVTVYREASEIESAALPAPLAELGDRIEVRVRPAPGGKGTEVAARLRSRGSSDTTAHRLSGTDAQADMRSALRQAKQVLEVGEVLELDPTPHGERTATPGGLLLEAWTKVAPRAGVR